jgi:CubicO group peptidase (beta-lactamase class C family)
MNYLSKSIFGGLLILAVPLALLSCERSVETPKAPVSPELKQQLKAFVDEHVMPGAVALVANKDGIIAKAIVGYQDVAESKPMTADTIFRLYSMSKPITSVGVMMLIEKGSLKLDQPLESILPEFAHMRVFESGTVDNMVTVPAERSITIRDLLIHESGITYHFTGNTPVHQYYRKYGVMRDTPVGRTPEDGEPAHSLDELVARLGKAPLLYQPGTEFAYSYSTTVLGAVIERVSGQSLDVYLRQNIFEPLGMRDTGFFIDDDKLDRFVTNYMMTDKGLTEIESPENSDYRDHHRLLDGGGAIAGTAHDYLRFARMLANGGELDGHRLLSAATVKEMFTEHTRIKNLGPEIGFGFGFALGDASTAKMGMMPAGTVGWAGSGNTFFWIRPETGDIVVFMTQVITPPPYYEVAGRFRTVVNSVADKLLSGG